MQRDSDSLGVAMAEVGDAMFFLEKGSARVVKDGEEVFVLKRGDFFGELALTMLQPRASPPPLQLSLPPARSGWGF